VRFLTLCFNLLHLAERPTHQGFEGDGGGRERVHGSRHGKDFKSWSVKGLNSQGTDTMKIESSSNDALAILQPNAVRATNNIGAVQPTSAAYASSSTVSLSSMSTLRTANASDIDTAKVASIKAALRDGSYKIDSGKIAGGMLSTARDMLQTRTL